MLIVVEIVSMEHTVLSSHNLNNKGMLAKNGAKGSSAFS